MSGGTQYGDLVRAAGQHILAASVELERRRFADPPAALRAVTAYQDLLHALSRHGVQLIGSDMRLLEIRRADADADPRDASASRLIDHLAYLGQRDLGAVKDGGEVSASWAAAASSIRAATDLLATHRDRYGDWRSPEAEVLEVADVQAAGWGELAAISIPVASAATTLGLRVGQSGVDWEVVQGLVPATGPLREVAIETRRLGGLSGTPLASLGVARPTVRTGDPVIELGDRLARLHRVAWQLARDERVGAGTLAEFAVGGVVVNEYAGQLMRQLVGTGSSAPTDLGVRRGMARFEEGGAAWRLVHLHLRQVRTTTPTLVGLRADVVAVRRLLDQLVSTALADRAASRELQAVVLGGARGFGDIARWNAQVLDRQAQRGQILVPGHFLTGDEVSDRPVLVMAKLRGSAAPAPKEHLQPLRDAYQTARTAAQDTTPGAKEPPISHQNPGRLLQS